jgi:hypothetical protein
MKRDDFLKRYITLLNQLLIIKQNKFEKLTSEVKILSEHPIYDAITKANMRKKKLIKS